MGTTIFRNKEKWDTKSVLELFSSKLEESENFSKSEIEELADIYSKNLVDKFIISDGELDDTFGRQGDILFWKKGSEMYNKEYKRVKGLHPTDRLVLQEGDSITGDHRVIPIKGSKYTIQEGKFIPSFLQGKTMLRERGYYNCIILEIDKPFLVFHREHGNMALTAGKYMICSQLDASTLLRMVD